MAGFLLDTNVLSEFAKAQPAHPNVDRWFKETPDDDLFASVMTLAEIRRGIALLPAGRRRTQLEEWFRDLEQSFSNRLLPVTKAIGDRWAVLSADASRRGAAAGLVDGIIAATAIEHNLIVVTRNVKDFASLGVNTLNPWEPVAS